MKKWDKSVIIEQLQRLHRAGVDMNAFTKLQKRHKAVVTAAFTYFGSYTAAMAAAGLDYRPSKPFFRNPAEVIDRIRRRQHEGKELWYTPVEKQEVALIRSGTRFFGNWEGALKASGIDPASVRRSQKTNPAEIIAQIQQMHKEGKDLSTAGLHASRKTWRLWSSACNHFGSYAAAITAAGLNYEKIKRDRVIWTKQRVLESIRERYAKGKDLSSIALPKLGGMPGAAIRLFGGWRAALAAAGVDYSKVRRYQNEWNADSIIERLRELHASGEDLSPGKMQPGNHSLYGAALRWHGSYRAALEKAGIDASAVYRLREWTPDSVINELRALHAAGEDLSFKRFDRAHGGLSGATRRLFGSYNAALEKAGIDWRSVIKRISWSRQDIIDGLRKIYAAEPKMTSGRLVREHSKLYVAGTRTFGGIGKALKAAGIAYKFHDYAPPVWPRERVIEEIKQMHRRGEDLTALASKKLPGLTGAARRYFGSWGAAINAAGLDYSKIKRVKEWSPDAVIQELHRLRSAGQNFATARMKEKHTTLLNAARKYHGSYRNALEKAGIKPIDLRLVPGSSAGKRRPKSYWTESRVLDHLRDLNRAGEDLRYRAVKTRHMPLYFAARDLFGSYANAIVEAKINYEQVVQRALKQERAALRKSRRRKNSKN